MVAVFRRGTVHVDYADPNWQRQLHNFAAETKSETAGFRMRMSYGVCKSVQPFLEATWKYKLERFEQCHP